MTLLHGKELIPTASNPQLPPDFEGKDDELDGKEYRAGSMRSGVALRVEFRGHGKLAGDQD